MHDIGGILFKINTSGRYSKCMVSNNGHFPPQAKPLSSNAFITACGGWYLSLYETFHQSSLYWEVQSQYVCLLPKERGRRSTASPYEWYERDCVLAIFRQPYPSRGPRLFIQVCTSLSVFAVVWIVSSTSAKFSCINLWTLVDLPRKVILTRFLSVSALVDACQRSSRK